MRRTIIVSLILFSILLAVGIVVFLRWKSARPHFSAVISANETHFQVRLRTTVGEKYHPLATMNFSPERFVAKSGRLFSGMDGTIDFDEPGAYFDDSDSLVRLDTPAPELGPNAKAFAIGSHRIGFCEKCLQIDGKFYELDPQAKQPVIDLRESTATSATAATK